MSRSNSSKKLNVKDYAKALLAQEHFWTAAEKETWRQSLKATLYSLRKLALQHVYVETPKETVGQNTYSDLEQLISHMTHRLSARETEHELNR